MLTKEGNPFPDLRIAVIIPCYKVAGQIEKVLRGIPEWVSLIICIDDACPEESGKVASNTLCDDPRFRLSRHDKNGGVGAAMTTGYNLALEEGADILVKLDGDGQMNPSFIGSLIQPIANGNADYVKGNRFFRINSLHGMPIVRVIGNAGLSFFAKLSSGYWDVFDPNNGFTAIHASVARVIPLDKIHPKYFFESDMLFRLNSVRAVIINVPMDSCYGDEESNLSVFRAFWQFPLCHFRNFGKRLFYNYLLRDFNLASLYLLSGIPMLLFGLIYGSIAWLESYRTQIPAQTGTIMIAVLPILLGFQLILSFLHNDIANIPRLPLHKRLKLIPAHLEPRQCKQPECQEAD